MTTKSMRQPTLETLGLGTVLSIFQNGRLPVTDADLVDKVFGKQGGRGSMVISGANGIVGAGKAMQLGSRLEPFGVRIVGLDFANAPDGIGKQYPGLVRAFGREKADRIMANIIRLSYDGTHLPSELKELKPRFLLEAIPEILEIKKAHYKVFREAFPGIEIRSVTSGFPSAELGVGIAHPAFPHEINKIWEIVEEKPSPVTQLLWALGMIPIPVSDHWSFVLDVQFCGLMLSTIRYGRASNMPYWKIDKYCRRLLGPNPLRAHDAIGAKGANFLTWSCLHHLSGKYGDVFKPTPELEEHKESGQNWYPPDHFRPLVNWALERSEEEELRTWLLGPMIQMTSLLLHEKRSHLSHMNAIGELCAQFRRGIPAVIRELGQDEALKTVEAYHKFHPQAAKSAWYPKVFSRMGDPDWQQLYVNAEHDGQVGVITLSRESYNRDVNAELNRAIDWLKAEKIDRVILTGDFHLSTQLVGADTSEFFPALSDAEKGFEVSHSWSKTARRLHEEFRTSVGFINGKRCLGGMLELMLHCHYLIAVEGAMLGLPEVTLPVVPGMEGCHWPFRKATPDGWPKLFQLALTGRPAEATQATGWLIDFAGPLEKALQTAWKIVTDGDHKLPRRKVEDGALSGLPREISGLPPSDNPLTEIARKAIMDCIQKSCAAPLSEALSIQSRHSGGFMTTPECKQGSIGGDFTKVMTV
jgi:enoyl-CoA hydratase/carnithine racemase/3-hydroxyacyl-CoA dehydrogenase